MSLAVCLACGTILESKHRHDFVQCLCPNRAMLDGGEEYTRCGAHDPRMYKGAKTQAEAKRLRLKVLERNFKTYQEHLNATFPAAKPKPREETYAIDWSEAPEWAKWHAFDADGVGFFYSARPQISREGRGLWVIRCVHDYQRSGHIKADVSGWRASRTKRPAEK